MRRLAPIAALLLAAPLLAACTLTSPGDGTATGVATEAIEVTPLDAPPASAAAPAEDAGTAQESPDAPGEGEAPGQSAPEAAPGDTSPEGTAPGDAAEAAAEEVAEPPPAAALPPAAQACFKRGGRWVGTGAGGLMACVRVTRDAGKSCRRESDCQGYCLARSRTCAPYTPLFGCNDVLGPNGERTTICLD